MVIRRTSLFLAVLMVCFCGINGSMFFSGENGLIFAQELKTLLFRETNQAFKEAQKAEADILAPKTFGEAMELYRKAQNDYNKGKSLDEIRKNLRSATARFQKAVEATKLANAAFGSAIQARADAVSAEAQNFSSKLWTEAESKFSGAARTLEEGNIKDAKKKAAEAEKLFRDAELQAIKTNYLNETYSILKEAEKQKVGEVAPKTLKKAQDLVKEAEKELNENRYDTDVARVLAKQAKREAKHALYLAGTIRNAREKKQTLEDLMLAAEKPITQIASSLNFVPSFEAGFKKPVDKIVERIKDYQNTIARQRSELFDAGQLNELLDARITELEQKLAGVELERSAFAKKLEAQARIRQLYDEVEKLFTGDIAIFIREGNDIIIRTVGLSFPVGKATIDPKYYDFLSRVNRAIAMFPNATVTVEGHTDSYGSDETNFKLSNDRAEAVKQYLIANSNLDASRIEAIGFGESYPVATNETDEGRARNRRIEIIIHPRLPES